MQQKSLKACCQQSFMAYKALVGCSILFLSKLVLSLILILPVPRVPKTLRQLLSLAGQENRGAGA